MTRSPCNLPLLMVAVMLMLAACGEPAASHAADDGHGHERDHAAASVVPGSHEDWCGEHAVPESKCSRCDPSLVPAFKATGDWCVEHGLPESQCLACNPALVITRPPKEGA